MLPRVKLFSVPTTCQQVARAFLWDVPCLVDIPDFWVRVKPSNMRWYISASSVGQSGVSLVPFDLNWLWFSDAQRKKKKKILWLQAQSSGSFSFVRPAGPSQALTHSWQHEFFSKRSSHLQKHAGSVGLIQDFVPPFESWQLKTKVTRYCNYWNWMHTKGRGDSSFTCPLGFISITSLDLCSIFSKESSFWL